MVRLQIVSLAVIVDGKIDAVDEFTYNCVENVYGRLIHPKVSLRMDAIDRQASINQV